MTMTSAVLEYDGSMLTDWVNSLVIREKANGRLRLCLDPKDLNRAIKRDHYPVPTLEEIILKLSDAKMFSKLDPRNQKRLLERRVR